MKDLKVLIVDDSKVILKINTNLCNELNINNIYTAENGQEAINIFNEHKDFDLIISDINMPIMNGFDFLKYVRMKDKNVNFYMCTTEGGREEVVKALRMGANNYIVKPIQREVLQSKIKDLMK